MSKLLYTRFTKLIIDYILSHNKSIPHKSDSKLHSSQDDQPITKLLSTTNDEYKFGMEVLDAMISDAIKKKAGYTYYMAKKVEIENVPNKLKKDDVPRKTRSLTIAEEAVVGSKASTLKSLKQKKQAVTGEGSSAAHNKYYASSYANSDATLYSSSSDESKESANKIHDADKPDMDLFDDNPNGDDDATRYGVFMHNKSTTTPNSTYLSSTVTSSSLNFIHTLLDETPVNELTNFMSHPVYVHAQTTSVVHNPEGNPELTSYIPGASEVPLENSLSYNNFPTKLTSSQSKEADAKGEKNMRKINFKKAVTQKFREYDQKMEALINFNVSKAFEKVVQAKVLTKLKKLLPTHILKVIANYVRPLMDLKLKLLNQIHKSKSNMTHPTNQKLYDTLYESVCLDHDELDAQAAQLSFHKSSYDNQDPLNNRKGRTRRKEERMLVNLLLDHQEEKYTTSITKHYAAKYYKQGIEDMISDRWSKETHRYIFEALNGIHHWIKSVVHAVVKKKWGYGFLTSIVVKRFDDKEYEFSYADLLRLSLNDVEDMYLFQVQDKLHHLPLEFVKYFHNALLLFIRRVIIQNRVEENQLEVESYQKTLNLTKPMMFFEGIDQKTPFLISETHKGVVYLSQHNIKSFMKLSKVNKFCDGTLIKICENLDDMVKRNKLGTGNKWLKGRDWTNMDVEKSNEMVDKIDKVLKHREQLRRLEEYVRGRPKTVNPILF
ncbi:hypothetical protein Tco_0199810 [Tanacetum coccineum]